MAVITAHTYKPYLSHSPPNLRHSSPISVSSSPFPLKTTIPCLASSALAAESPLTAKVGNAKKDFLHIDDFDKETILKILDRAIEVKALLLVEWQHLTPQPCSRV
ncbi:ornithine carbamoyltransferase, chloroplastic-like [Cicer arietinum]|uniref:ornithine carbamoyltransferase, chloroplastic-like n=1 Tax=Cicer arietinum TaxID=3827 RepID=UPI00032AD1E9